MVKNRYQLLARRAAKLERKAKKAQLVKKTNTQPVQCVPHNQPLPEQHEVYEAPQIVPCPQQMYTEFNLFDTQSISWGMDFESGYGDEFFVYNF